jgi:hypothetical protein
MKSSAERLAEAKASITQAMAIPGPTIGRPPRYPPVLQ